VDSAEVVVLGAAAENLRRVVIIGVNTASSSMLG